MEVYDGQTKDNVGVVTSSVGVGGHTIGERVTGNVQGTDADDDAWLSTYARDYRFFAGPSVPWLESLK